MGGIGDVTSSGGFPNNLPDDPSGAGTQPQQQVSPDAPAVFVSSGGTPPERTPGQHANASFRAAGRQAAADPDRYEQRRSALRPLGFDDEDVGKIIRKRPDDAVLTVGMPAQVAGDLGLDDINSVRHLTPSQLVMLAVNCARVGWKPPT